MGRKRENGMPAAPENKYVQIIYLTTNYYHKKKRIVMKLNGQAGVNGDAIRSSQPRNVMFVISGFL